jgi:hypothetical protein
MCVTTALTWALLAPGVRDRNSSAAWRSSWEAGSSPRISQQAPNLRSASLWLCDLAAGFCVQDEASR